MMVGLSTVRQGSVWYHELMHIDWVSKARSYGSNPHITDMSVEFLNIDGTAEQGKAYSALWTKILARYPAESGKYVWQNANNLALYVLAVYVQSKLGNTYPHLPTVTSENMRRPWQSFWVNSSNGTVQLNTSNPIAAEMVSEPRFQGCPMMWILWLILPTC